MKSIKGRINTIEQADCMDFLLSLPPKIFDLAIVDPPYNLNKGDWDRFAGEAEFRAFTAKWIACMMPLLKETASLYIFNTPYNCAFMLNECLRQQAVFRNWITWHKKDAFSSSKKKFVSYQETILFFTMSEDYLFNADAVREPYESEARINHARKKGLLKNGKRWFPNASGRLCGDVWHFSSQRHHNKRNGRLIRQSHPTIKPDKLIKRILLASSLKNDLVLDLFSGSGTTSFMCDLLERRYLGCEIDKQFCSLARQRINGNPGQFVAQ